MLQNLSQKLQRIQPKAQALEPKLAPHVGGEVLVRTADQVSLESLEQDYGAQTLHRFKVPNVMKDSYKGDLTLVKLDPAMSVAEALLVLGDDERVTSVSPNHIKESSATPNDMDPRLWGMPKIDAPLGWDTSVGSNEGPVVAVIDTGIDYRHPDLAANVWTNPAEVPGDGVDNDENGLVDDVHGANMDRYNGDPMDDGGHGTHCAGTIGAVGNNDIGVVGVNWNSQLMGVKFLNEDGRGTSAGVIRSVFYATEMGARITSNSYGGGGSETEKEAFEKSPLLHIAAAGNSSRDIDRRAAFPAAYDLPNIVSVAASDQNDELASFSNWGLKNVDLAAPGVDTLSTVPGGGYDFKSGTSMATPHVAGAAAILATHYPEISNQEMKHRLMAGADPTSFSGFKTAAGRLNLANSLDNDSIPPAVPKDFRPLETSKTSVKIGWTATGDDGWCGKANGYRVLMSKTGDFSEASLVPTARPGEAGTLETASVSLFPSDRDREIHFQLEVLDNVSNASPAKTTTATVPATRVAFVDHMEEGTDKWIADEGWGVVDDLDKGRVWTESPDGKYGANLNTSLTSKPFSLEGFEKPQMLIDYRCQVEEEYDYLHFEVKREGEEDWSKIATFSERSDWRQDTFDLSEYEGDTIQLRFRVQSDEDVGLDGFRLNKIAVL
jgi:hypothetical protein